MKITKILSLVIAIVLILGAFSLCASAEENQSVDFDLTVNGEYYLYGEFFVKMNEALEIQVADVFVDGETVDQTKISYKWEKSCPPPNGMPGLAYEEIADANESIYSTTYDGTERYRCTVTVEGVGYRSKEICLKEDSLTTEVSANKPLVYEAEGDNYCINDLSVGDEVTLTINATTTLEGATTTYSWNGGDAYIQPDSELDEWGQVSNNTNTLTVTKREGQQNYFCTVSDGQATQFIFFMLNSTETMTHSILANGEHPGTYAGTYIYVTKPNTDVKIEIPATSTKGDVEYSWYYDAEGYSIPERLDNTTNTVIATKSPMTEQNPYAWEVYQCFLEDGNDRVRYWIMLFCLDPETPLSEVKKIGEDTPEIEIKSENEDLANAVFNGDELMALSGGAPIEVTLSAESKQTVSQSEKTAIDEKLTADSNVGMYLDINIYKGFEGAELDQVAELNKAIDISVDMPQNLVDTKEGVKREYSVVRVHNGVAETIPCAYNETTKTLEFSSDKFSTYTIVYTDKEDVATPGESGSGEAEKQPDKPEANKPETNKTEVPQTTSPLTGDSSATSLWVMVIMVSGFAVVSLLTLKKTKNHAKH
ncbi:MAG: hypothetical protein J6B22_04690 [Clostridia bacterium]|nr:hypothetical protein [Clostridia bacterium]